MAKLDMSSLRKRTRAARSSMAERDEQLKAVKESATAAVMRLDRIEGRAHSDTRSLRLDHVIDLMESIAVLGLIEPIVVDQRNRLLAGGHRLAACRLLAQPAADRAPLAAELTGSPVKPKSAERLAAIVAGDDVDLRRVPVRVIGIDSAAQADVALAIEASENTLRRDYTSREVRSLYDRLRDAGYVDRPGRPRKGERAIKPAIATIIGRSIRTVERMLAEPPAKTDELVKALRLLTRQIERIREAAGDDAPESTAELLKRLDSPTLRNTLRVAIRDAKHASDDT